MLEVTFRLCNSHQDPQLLYLHFNNLSYHLSLCPHLPCHPHCLSTSHLIHDDEGHTYIQLKTNTRMSTLATVDPTSVKAPVLTASNISLVVMMDFEKATLDFFVSKSVPDEKQVTMIIPRIKDIHIHDWITAKCDHIVALPFADFMKEMHLNYLPQDWEDQVWNDILTSMLASSASSFWNWSQKILKLNCLLCNTASAFDETALCNHLKAHLDNELKAKVRHSEAQKDKNFKTWVGAVRLLDKAHTVKTKHPCELIEEMLQHQAKRQNTNNDALRGPLHHGNSLQTNVPSSSSSTSYVHLPALTDAECTLLKENDGCTKCRQFYAGHWSRSCPDSFLQGKEYKTLTAADMLAAKKAKAISKPNIKAVAATSTTIEAVNSDEEVSAAATVLPESSHENNSDSDKDWDVSHHEVSPEIHAKHLIWNCQIHSLTNDFPVRTCTLIDNGTHLVLICPELMEQLRLKIHKLHKPELIDVAFSKEVNKTELYDYVKLSLMSLDVVWTSKSVRAIITPGLCMPIILSLPWLIHNTIVTDHAACTCIDKVTQYDLLNPKPILPPPPKLKVKEQIKNTKANKKLVLAELMMVCNDRLKNLKLKPEEVKAFDIAGAVQECIEILAGKESLMKHENKLKAEFKPVFEPIPHVDGLPQDVVVEIHIKDTEKTIKSCSYPSPCKYKEAWQILIQQHLDASHIRPSSSPCTSPAFIVPKANPNVLPRWVNNFHQLNENTVTDSHLLPRIDDILNDCAKGKIWATIDMTNSFFQTQMHPEHVHLTVVNTPLSLYEWLVMPMGLKNAPAIHQRQVMAALRHLIGKMCHIYLDDIVIWSNSMDEHETNIHTVLQALRNTQLYVNLDKTHLFCTNINFLGHHISTCGIKADTKKVDHILSWPIPNSATETRGFLGLVRYIAAFLPSLTDHTGVLTKLMMKDSGKNFPPWVPKYQMAFDVIKTIVTGWECLTMIDFTKMPEFKIFVTTDASNKCSGAILLFGHTWESAHPVTFNPMTFKGTELNYPVHEKELLAVIWALKKWQVDLLGSSFFIYTDHKTLKNFTSQKDLSHCQACWMELMSQFNTKIVYIKGEDNCIADALS